MTTIQASRDQTNVPIGVHVARDVGITGLTVVARIFDGDDLSRFLDFNDGTFKDAGHTTPTTPLAEVQATTNPGYYAIDGGFDLSAITIPGAASSLVVQYEITAGGEAGQAVDVIQFTDALDAVLDDTAAIEPVVSANLDAAITTRATPGDAMTLTAAERTAIDGVLTAAHGAGAWTSLTAAQVTQLEEVWTLLGANIAAPVSFDAAALFVQALAAGIDIAIDVAGTTVTLTRQP